MTRITARSLQSAHPQQAPYFIRDDKVKEVTLWQNRPLDEIYPIVYLDGLKEVLGLWTAETEGAQFWLQVVTELKNRGVQDIFIAFVDGLKGFPEAIETVFPDT